MQGQSEDHVHTYDAEGNLTCCTLEEKIDRTTKPSLNVNRDNHGHDHKHESNHDGHSHDHEASGRIYLMVSLIMLLMGMVIDFGFTPSWFSGSLRLIWYGMAYVPVALPVIKEAWEGVRKGEIFTEFFLMVVATIGAFIIGEYPEGVAVMVFYTLGEAFQMAAVQRAKSDIKALLDVRPDTVHVFRNETWLEVLSAKVKVGEKIQIRPGEKVALDGRLLSDAATVNMAALSGESVPVDLTKGQKIFAGSINITGLIEIEVDALYENSTISKVLEMVQNATAKKAKTELLIRKLAKVYTPVVVFLALGVFLIPYFFDPLYTVDKWLYRALVFLVISCPCALVISIPLGYFGGLGAASRHGILFKGASFLDLLPKMNILFTDKTGTVTEGIFTVHSLVPAMGVSQMELLSLAMSLESKSTHPVAKAVMEYKPETFFSQPIDLIEIAGKGLKGVVDGDVSLAGNARLMEDFAIKIPEDTLSVEMTTVLIAKDGKYMGSLVFSDRLKSDAMQAITGLKKEGIREIIMLSGDKQNVVSAVGSELGLTKAIGGMLPGDKLEYAERYIGRDGNVVGYLGDGINDAPVLAISDIGFAMGGMGSDLAVETADVIIQTDQPSKVLTAIKIAKSTREIIFQNISLAIVVKIVVLIMGAGGIATLWEAVFADVGVALLAILNAVRIQGKNFNIPTNLDT